MDVAPVAEPVPWQSAATPASDADVFTVSVTSTTATAGNGDSWADFGSSSVTSSAATAESSEDDGWADFASFDSVQSQSCSTR